MKKVRGRREETKGIQSRPRGDMKKARERHEEGRRVTCRGSRGY